MYWLLLFGPQLPRLVSHKKLMSHWKERDDWLNKGQTYTQTELWHDEQFRELSWFWNPEEYTLPELCSHCRTIVPTSVIKKAAVSTDSPVCLKCTKCICEIILYQRTVQGDPRNQAIIIHEDGWCSFSTSTSNSIAAITITRACMSKADHSASDAHHARLYSFVPVSQLPRGAPHKFDAFLNLWSGKLRSYLLKENKFSSRRGCLDFQKQMITLLYGQYHCYPLLTQRLTSRLD